MTLTLETETGLLEGFVGVQQDLAVFGVFNEQPRVVAIVEVNKEGF